MDADTQLTGPRVARTGEKDQENGKWGITHGSYTALKLPRTLVHLSMHFFFSANDENEKKKKTASDEAQTSRRTSHDRKITRVDRNVICENFAIADRPLPPPPLPPPQSERDSVGVAARAAPISILISM